MKEKIKKLDKEKIILIFTIIFICGVVLYKITFWNQISKNSDEYKFAEYLYSSNLTKIVPEQTPFDRYMTNYETALLLKRLYQNDFFGESLKLSWTHDCQNLNFSGLESNKDEILESCNMWFFDVLSWEVLLTWSVSEKQFVNSLWRLVLNNQNKSFDEIYDYLLSKNILEEDIRNQSYKMITRKEIYQILSKIKKWK